MTVPQNMQALKVAETVRLERMRLKHTVNALCLADGRDKIADLLDKREPAIQSMTIGDLLRWIRRNSDRAIEQALESAGLNWDGRLVRELTDRQIIAIEDALVLQAEGVRERRVAA